MKVSPNIDEKTKSKNYVLHLMYIVLKILGLAPYKYIKSELRFKVSILGNLHSLLYSIILMSLLWPMVLYKIEYSKESKLFITNLKIFLTGSVISTAIVHLLTIIFNSNRMCTLINEFMTLDKELDRLGIIIDNEPILKNLSIYITITTILTSILVTIDFFMVNNKNELLLYVFWMSDISAFIIDTVAVFQFTCFLYFISKRFILLNQNISNDWNNGKINIFTIKPKKPCMDHLKSIYTIHDKLYDIAKSLNSIYSLHILLTINATFITLVYDMYFLYLMLNPNTTTELTYQSLWVTLAWSSVAFLTLIPITSMCSNVQEAACHTSGVIYKIKTNNKQTRSTVEMLSLQLRHQNLEFKACGFFTVDIAMIFTMCGAIATYLVFLIQFEIASREHHSHNHTIVENDN